MHRRVPHFCSIIAVTLARLCSAIDADANADADALKTFHLQFLDNVHLEIIRIVIFTTRAMLQFRSTSPLSPPSEPRAFQENYSGGYLAS